MKTFFKWLGVALAVVILLVLTALATLGWWLPPLAETQARQALADLGFDTVELTVERFGYSGVTITGLALENAQAEVALRSVTLDYSLGGLLLRRQAESLAIDGLDVAVYVPEVILAALPEDKEDGPTSTFTEPVTLPDALSLPVKNLMLEDSSLTLEADGWRKRLALSAYLEDGRPARFLLQVGDTDDALELSGVFDTRKLSSETTFELRSAKPAEWRPLLKSLPLPAQPEGLTWDAGALELEGALRTTDQATLGTWTVLGSLNALEADSPLTTARFGLFNFGANGEGLLPEKVWAGLFNGEADLKKPLPTRFTWDAATLETLEPERVYLKLEGWELTGDFNQYKLGDISASAGPLRLLLDGPWGTVRDASDLDAFSARLMMAQSPVEIFTGKGSISGQAAAQAILGPAAETLPDNAKRRSIEGALTLKSAEINSGPANFTADEIKVTLTGGIPDALSLALSLTNAAATWAEGAGKLSGVYGVVAIEHLLPLSMPEKQTLHFERLEQGKVVVNNGEVTVAYHPASGEEPTEISLTAGGDFAGGRIAGRVIVSLGEPISTQADLLLQRVSLERLAAFFPQFQGKIQGYVSGEIPLKTVGKRIVLQPGYLEMAAGETGKISYYRKGWLTQDPSLDPVEYTQDKDLITLMKQPNGANILTELAFHDLNLTAFRIDILKPGEGDRRVIVHLEGDGYFKDVKVPVVQDIRVGGDVKEAINLMLLMNEKLEFVQ